MDSVLELAQRLAHTPTILVADDDQYIRDMFEVLAKRYDVAVTCVGRPQQALDHLEANRYDALFLDIKFEEEMTGLDVLKIIAYRDYETHVIVMAGSINIDMIMAEANQAGVISFMLKPIQFSGDYLRRALTRLGIRLLPKPETKVDDFKV